MTGKSVEVRHGLRGKPHDAFRSNSITYPPPLVTGGVCNHIKQYHEMKEVILKRVPETKIDGKIGREASFEVEVDRVLVYSKLKTMAFPDFHEVANIVEETCLGMPVRVCAKQQPIQCSIM